MTILINWCSFLEPWTEKTAAMPAGQLRKKKCHDQFVMFSMG